MSRVIENLEGQQGGCKAVGTVVLHDNGKYFLVDTANTFDRGPETMVFEYSIRSKKVKCWNELYVDTYETMDAALKAHNTISENLEAYIPYNIR